MLKKYLNLQTGLAALLAAVPVVLHAFIPKVPVEVFAAGAAAVGAKLLHTTPPAPKA
jgi:hypothetical protein